MLPAGALRCSRHGVRKKAVNSQFASHLQSQHNRFRCAPLLAQMVHTRMNNSHGVSTKKASTCQTDSTLPARTVYCGLSGKQHASHLYKKKSVG
ncbi:hypothetical protein AVEN_72054-1 [Araneus ventricosus]|uniref:Uncharacterized protein n=1 Tax=Araneus ventricosus TaxID=182803 RepID=A0A4Y2SA15_ARAVE|nr:hypothetical protein AVEN_72054-1 [Araneus ventricosus]